MMQSEYLRSELSRRKSFIFKQLRIIVLAIRGFLNDKISSELQPDFLFSFYGYSCCSDSVSIAKLGLDQLFKTDNQKSGLSRKFFHGFSEARIAMKNQGRLYSRDRMIILFWSVMSFTWSYRNLIQSYMADQMSRPWYRNYRLPDYNAYCTCFHCSFQRYHRFSRLQHFRIIMTTHPILTF